MNLFPHIKYCVLATLLISLSCLFTHDSLAKSKPQQQTEARYSATEPLSLTTPTKFKAIQKEAKRGNIKKKFTLALCYLTGSGTAISYKKAFQTFFSITQQDPDGAAANNLGTLYQQGLGTPQDLNEAARWYAIAANKGCAYAQHSLGECYYSGEGVEQNIQIAAEWFLKAAQQGDAAAQAATAFLYSEGKGVNKDMSQAIYWLTAAATQGLVSAQFDLGSLHAKDNGPIPQNMQEAHRWFSLAADQGHMKSQYLLGLMYARGLGVEHDKKMAAHYFRKAALQGHEDAQWQFFVWDDEKEPCIDCGHPHPFQPLCGENREPI